MAHNPPVVTRKTKSSRVGYPSRSQQITDKESPKEKIPKLTSTRDVQTMRRVKATGHVPPNTATKTTTVADIHRLGVCHIVGPFKTRVTGGGGAGGGAASPGQKYHREQSHTPPTPTPKTTRTMVTHPAIPKLTPKEIRALREQVELKDFKNTKEYKDVKEVKTFKEPKEPQPKAADKSANLSHRHSRHQSDRTKTYFDKYLKFAYDLSTPEGVKQLEAHFFPDKDLGGAGTSTKREE